MVVIHLKISDANQFLYETSTNVEISDLIKDLVLVNNIRTRIDQICMALEDLLKYGPLKPVDVRGLNSTENIEPEMNDKYKIPQLIMPEKIGSIYNEDKSGHRTGWILEENINNTVMKGIIDAREYINVKRIQEKKMIKLKELFDFLELLKAGVMIAYPGYYGLPEWEPCKLLLEDKSDIKNLEIPGTDYFKLDNTHLWNSGKEYERGKRLSDYIGNNEKTKIICKFTTKGTGAPVREPVIDEETHKKMLSFYYKKQEEIKKLEGHNDDSYMNSKWADPKGLKKSLYQGDKDISWKFK